MGPSFSAALGCVLYPRSILLRCDIGLLPGWRSFAREPYSPQYREKFGGSMSDLAIAEEARLTAAVQERPLPRSGVAVALIELALAVGSFGIGTGEFAIMGLLPNLAQEFGVTTPQAGHAISAYALGVVVGAPIIAVLA